MNMPTDKLVVPVIVSCWFTLMFLVFLAQIKWLFGLMLVLTLMFLFAFINN